MCTYMYYMYVDVVEAVINDEIGLVVASDQ